MLHDRQSGEAVGEVMKEMCSVSPDPCAQSFASLLVLLYPWVTGRRDDSQLEQKHCPWSRPAFQPSGKQKTCFFLSHGFATFFLSHLSVASKCSQGVLPSWSPLQN